MKVSYEKAKKYSQKIRMYKKRSRNVVYEGYFIDCRIDKDSLPENVFMYHIRHSDDDFAKPVTIEPFVLVNFFGTFITNKELVFENKKDPYIAISRVCMDYEQE